MDPPPVQYVKTQDGYDIAYCVSGEGVPFVLMPFPFNNLYLMWHHQARNLKFFTALAQRFRLIQYDSRGHGMSGRGLRPEHSMDDYLIDLDAVTHAVGVDRFVLLGGPLFANAAERYALTHPDRVSGLVLLDDGSGDAWGGAQGMGRLESTARDNWEVVITFVSGGMEATPEERRYYHESITQQDFLTIIHATYGSSLDDRLGEIRVPTLVMCTRMASSDRLIIAGKLAAALVPNARLVLFEDWPHHIYPSDDSLPPVIPVLEDFVRSLPSGAGLASVQVPLDVLSSREMEVLRLLAAGKSNQQIADELVISLNTVRRHVSNIFDKTGVANRTEAAGYARDHGLR
jgi:DNA-binding CsgD family transcriptional regulator